MKKIWFLPPCWRRRISYRGGPRNACYLQNVRGVRANGPFALDNGVFRLRQHGTFLSCSETCGSESHMFRNKHVPFHPAGGASGQLSRQTPGFGTDRVTRVTYRTYAVCVQTGRLLSITAYFACGSMVPFLAFWKNCARRAQFFQKRMSCSTLPEAKPLHTRRTA